MKQCSFSIGCQYATYGNMFIGCKYEGICSYQLPKVETYSITAFPESRIIELLEKILEELKQSK